MGSLTPICVQCGREMRCEKNGVYIYHPLEHTTPGPIQEGNIVYTDRMLEGSWKEGDIDFVTEGDKYKCPTCGHEVIVDCGHLMIASPFTGFSQRKLKGIIKKAREKTEVIEIRRK